MRTRPQLSSLVFCLVAVLLCNAALFGLSQRQFQRELGVAMREHLAAALDESLFSDDKGRVNDSVSIAYIAHRINRETAQWVTQRWYAAIESRSIAIQAIDGIVVEEEMDANSGYTAMTIAISRNAVPRSIALSYRSDLRWPAFALLTAGMLAMFGSARRFMPSPLSATQSRWLRKLIDASYEPGEASALIEPLSDMQLTMTPRQLQVFDLLHAPSKRNFDSALRAAMDKRAASLSELDLQWLAAVWAATSDIDAAWQAATHADRVNIELVNGRLRIRGRDVGVTKTPLFYYAWYALQRLRGDGWMLNPPSNRPDKDQGGELAALMWKYKGHAKAISELEQRGLRAKTLDQNRSKIKEEFQATLGPALAEHYLFDTQKDAMGRIRYRLKVEPASLAIIEVSVVDAEPKQHFA